MSTGSVGGASFDLSVNRQRFNDDLGLARQDAERAAQEIGRILGSAGSGAGGGFGVATQDVRALGTAGSVATDRLEELATQLDRTDGAAVRALDSAVQLAAAYDNLAANARELATALASTEGVIGRQGGAVAQQAQAVAQAVTVQASAASAAAQQAANVTEQSSKRIVDATRAQADAQRAVNTLRTAFGREDVTTGRGLATEAAESAERGRLATGTGDIDRGLREIQQASNQARGALAEVNAELSRLVAANPGIAQAAAGMRTFEQELNRLVALGSQQTDADQRRLQSMLSGSVSPDKLFGDSEDDEGADDEAEKFNQLNANAKTLTTSLEQLGKVEAELAGRGAGARQAAQEQAAAIRAQEKATRDLLATQRQQEQQAKTQAALDAAARQQTLVASTVGATQTALANDPDVQAAIAGAEALEQAGLTAKEAETAVNGLQRAINALGKSQGVKDLKIGFDQGALAAQELHAALLATGSGDVQVALAAEERAIKAINEALVRADVAANHLRQTLRDEGTTEERALLQLLTARASALQTVRTSLQQSSGGTGLQGPETRRIAEAEAERERQVIAARRESLRLAREENDAIVARARIATGAQNALGAIGLGTPGRAVGGVGRASASIETAGITESAAASIALTTAVIGLGGALVETTRNGLAFNQFLETAAVRMGAARGSAADATKELEHLLQLSVSRNFGSFGTEDLAAGLEKLERLGQNTPTTLNRIANTAAATGETFATTATQIAVFYDRLSSGLPLDDTLQGLINSGVLTAQLAAQLRAADTAGASAAEKIEIFNAALDRFDGTADKTSRTTAGAFQRITNETKILAGAALENQFNLIADAVQHVADALADPRIADGIKKFTELSNKLALTALLLQANPAAAGIVQVAQAVQQHVTGGQAEQVGQKITDDRNTLLQDRYAQNRAAVEAGREAVISYARGFNEEAAGQFSTLEDLVRGHLEALGGGEISNALKQRFAGEIEPILARVAADIQKYGSVTAETSKLVSAAMGDEALKVLELANLYGKQKQAADDLTAAKKALAEVKTTAEYHDTVAADILKIDQQAISDAEKNKKAHEDAFDKIIEGQREIARGWGILQRIFHDSYQEAIDALDKQIKGKQRANEEAARDAADTIRGLQDSLGSYQEEVDNRRQAARDALDAMRENIAGLQEEVRLAQQAETDHQAAYQAVLSGTIDLFNQEHQQQDDITRAIIAKWDAEISGARRAKAESDQLVRARTEQEHLLTLAYEKRIAAARAAGREDQARALERERDRVIAASQQAGRVDEAQARVDADRLEDRTKDAQDEARRTGSGDRVAVNTAQGRVDAAQQELDLAEKVEQARERAEDEEVKRRQAAIEHAQRQEQDRARAAALEIQGLEDRKDALQEEQKASDKYFQSIVDNINDNTIPAIERSKVKQQAADQQKIDDAKTILEADQEYWRQRKIADDAAVTAAQGVVDAATAALTEYGKQIDAFKTINSQLDSILLKTRQYLNDLRAAAGLPKLPDILPGGATSPVEGNVPEYGSTPQPANPTPAAPKAGPAGSNAPAAQPILPTDPTRPQLPLLPATSSAAPPQGYHEEIEEGGTHWYVPNYMRLEDYSKVPARSGGAPTDSTRAPQRALLGASTVGGGESAPGGFEFARTSVSGPQVGPYPDYPTINIDTSAHAHAFTGQGARYLDVPVSGAGRGLQVAGNLVHIETVNASDPRDVEQMIGTIENRIFGSGIAGHEISKRGGLWPGRFGGQG